jgi:hypothetical protein
MSPLEFELCLVANYFAFSCVPVMLLPKSPGWSPYARFGARQAGRDSLMIRQHREGTVQIARPSADRSSRCIWRRFLVLPVTRRGSHPPVHTIAEAKKHAASTARSVPREWKRKNRLTDVVVAMVNSPGTETSNATPEVQWRRRRTL